ncbi:hypothetical protein HHI36_004891 [Cryptolaemus montrouzieri]|uniref:Integrase catalytic domain-containing protein n=1 Tax=Cryptolaemus montrouzieri TaxID=559131 RepID=A0ABD2NSP4_9CUCU
MLTNQYPGINSQEFKNFLKSRNITLMSTSINTSFSNGLNERLNQTLVNKIRCIINEKNNQYAWTTIAQTCINKYNSTEHTVTKFSPKYLLYGEDTSILPTELEINDYSNKLEEDRRKSLENSIRYHNYNKELYDKNKIDYDFKVGDTYI